MKGSMFGGLLLLTAAGCAELERSDAERRAELRARVERALDRSLDEIAYVADSIDDALQPVPLLTGAERSALRRYLNEDHLAAARSLGVPRPETRGELESLVEAGRLVELEDSTRLWVVRELDYSVPYVTPDAHAMLVELATRFQQRIERLGLPPFRLEVTSVLRTAESQAELRAGNPNAARGVSTHEFGTTLDVAYSGFAAPAGAVTDIDTPEAVWLESRLERVADAVAETVAARRSRELQAILGQVLIEMQEEGKLMVTLERQQPVYHMTVAADLAG